MVMEKTKDIAVLMSMGSTQITGAEHLHRARCPDWRNRHGDRGLLAAVHAISDAGGHYHLISLSPEVYSIDYVPFAPRLKDGLWVVLVAVGISFVATLYPSMVRRQNPPSRSVALRVELCGTGTPARECV